MSDLFSLTDVQMAKLSAFFPRPHGKPLVDGKRVLGSIIFIPLQYLLECRLHLLECRLQNNRKESPITDFEREYAFAGDMDAQFQLIKDAFHRGDEREFEQALRTVCDARDGLRRGILDMVRDAD